MLHTAKIKAKGPIIKDKYPRDLWLPSKTSRIPCRKLTMLKQHRIELLISLYSLMPMEIIEYAHRTIPI